jgi:hypothetical protein
MRLNRFWFSHSDYSEAIGWKVWLWKGRTLQWRPAFLIKLSGAFSGRCLLMTSGKAWKIGFGGTAFGVRVVRYFLKNEVCSDALMMNCTATDASISPNNRVTSFYL